MMQMQEELIAFVPVLLLLTRQLGFTPVTAVAMSLGAAAVGAAFSPTNGALMACWQRRECATRTGSAPPCRSPAYYWRWPRLP